MATESSLLKPLNEPHPPNERGVQLFQNCASTIRNELVKLRHHWDKHEPRMFARAASISDHDLCRFNIPDHLELIRAGKTSYGDVVLGKIRLPALNDAEGNGFIHVRLHDPPGEGNHDVIFHSILTDEVKDPNSGHITSYRAIMRKDDPLMWFNE